MEKVDVQEETTKAVEHDAMIDATDEIDAELTDRMAKAADDIDKTLTDLEKSELMQQYFAEMMRKINRRRTATKKKVTPSQRKSKRNIAKKARRKNRK